LLLQGLVVVVVVLRMMALMLHSTAGKQQLDFLSLSLSLDCLHHFSLSIFFLGFVCYFYALIGFQVLITLKVNN
jgi:hypothetical protein